MNLQKANNQVLSQPLARPSLVLIAFQCRAAAMHAVQRGSIANNPHNTIDNEFIVMGRGINPIFMLISILAVCIFSTSAISEVRYAPEWQGTCVIASIALGCKIITSSIVFLPPLLAMRV